MFFTINGNTLTTIFSQLYMNTKAALVVIILLVFSSCCSKYADNISSEGQVSTFYFYQMEGTTLGVPYSMNGVSQHKYIISKGKSSLDILKKMYKKIYYSPDIYFGMKYYNKKGIDVDHYIDLSSLIDKYSSEYSIKCINNDICKLKILRIKGKFYKCPTSAVGKTSLEPVNLLPLKPESYVLQDILNILES